MKANRGAAVDGSRSTSRLISYKLWNRLSSGATFLHRCRWFPKVIEVGGAHRGPLRPGSGAIWSLSSRFSTRTPIAIALAGQRSTLSGRLVSVAGDRLGARLDVQSYFEHRLGAGSSVTYGLSVGASVHQRWLKAPYRRTACRHASGRGCQRFFRCIMFSMRGWSGPIRPFRSSRRRHDLPLPKRRGGKGIKEVFGGSVCSLQAGFTSREDATRLLQGCEPARRLPEPVLRFSGLPVSPEEIDPWVSPRCLLPACWSESAHGPAFGGGVSTIGATNPCKILYNSIRGWLPPLLRIGPSSGPASHRRFANSSECTGGRHSRNPGAYATAGAV